MTRQLQQRDVYSFVAAFGLLWIGAWLVYNALTGSTNNTLLMGSLDSDTAYWIVAKLFVWVLFPIVYFKNKISEPR